MQPQTGGLSTPRILSLVIGVGGGAAVWFGSASAWITFSVGFSIDVFQIHPNVPISGLDYPTSGGGPSPGEVCLVAAAIGVFLLLLAQVHGARFFAVGAGIAAFAAAAVAWSFRTSPPDAPGSIFQRSGIEELGPGTGFVIAGAVALGSAALVTLVSRRSATAVVHYVPQAAPSVRAGVPLPPPPPPGTPMAPPPAPGTGAMYGVPLLSPPATPPPAPPRSGSARRVRVAVAGVLVGVLAIWGVSAAVRHDSSSDAGVSLDDTRATTSTLSVDERTCVVEALDTEASLAHAADQAHQRHDDETVSIGSDSSYAEFGSEMLGVDLLACPGDFAASFSRYASAWLDFGRWLEDHSGAGGLIGGTDRSGGRQRAAVINSSLTTLSSLADTYAPGHGWLIGMTLSG